MARSELAEAVLQEMLETSEEKRTSLWAGKPKDMWANVLHFRQCWNDWRSLVSGLMNVEWVRQALGMYGLGSGLIRPKEERAFHMQVSVEKALDAYVTVSAEEYGAFLERLVDRLGHSSFLIQRALFEKGMEECVLKFRRRSGEWTESEVVLNRASGQLRPSKVFRNVQLAATGLVRRTHGRKKGSTVTTSALLKSVAAVRDQTASAAGLGTMAVLHFGVAAGRRAQDTLNMTFS